MTLMLMLSVLATFGVVSAYASHGSSGGGGGCSGDCKPPTLGLDERGVVRVEGGLTINSESFDVENYSQTIPTQTFKVGQKNTVSLKIYENTVPEFLSHVELHFNTYDKVIQGVTLEDSTVSIVWDDTGGDVVYAVNGDENMIQNLRIDQQIKDELALVTFEFEFTKPIDTSTLMVIAWDEKRNPSKNYFYDAIRVIDEPISDSSATTDLDVNIVEYQESEVPVAESDKKITIPSWIKTTAGWWSEDNISDSDFVLAIHYLVDEQILSISQVTNTESSSSTNEEVPSWIKNTAGWWAKGDIPDEDFVLAVQYLLTENIVNLKK